MFRLLIWFFCAPFFFSFSQENKGNSYVDVNYFKGYVPLHNPDILHLIKGRPEGTLIAWNQRTDGQKEWHRHYNYPDYGASFMFQDFQNPVLGKAYGFYGHFNFYFLKRRMMLRVGQGVVISSNPYDKNSNPKNIAFGSKLLASPYLMLNYKKSNLIGPLGIQTGLLLFHASNGNIKAPNTSVNTIAFNIGLNYELGSKEIIPEYLPEEVFISEGLKINLVFRSGLNQISVVGGSQFPFYTFSVYADKRFNFFSAFQFGFEASFSQALKEEIYYRSIAFPETPSDSNADYRRIGTFLGYELFINNLSAFAQLGYYIYYPYDFEGRLYNRIGLKYYFGGQWFGAFSVKSHSATAEAIEFGIGIRF